MKKISPEKATLKQLSHWENLVFDHQEDFEKGKVVPLDKALNEEPPSTELQKIFNDIEQMDAERRAWKKMFDMQSKIVMGLELDKIRLENENKTLQGYLDNINKNLKTMTGEA